MPECISGESPQDYFSRVLSQCALESATTAENASGDSAPTPFNIGQIQSDLAQAQTDIEALQTSDGEQQTSIDTLTAQIACGVQTYAISSTSAAVAFPSEGTWKVVVTPIGQTLAAMWISISASSFTLNYTSAGAAGSFSWIAVKET